MKNKTRTSKSSAHDDLVKAARDAINAVFGDRSVPPETTVESLEDLAADIEANVTAIEDDLRQRK